MLGPELESTSVNRARVVACDHSFLSCVSGKKISRKMGDAVQSLACLGTYGKLYVVEIKTVTFLIV